MHLGHKRKTDLLTEIDHGGEVDQGQLVYAEVPAQAGAAV
jgi:hypothetical protein